ncbi:MAG: hypothetical protein M3362_06230 [Acidobacteriota bacterium]|nr:hypothetical protein [Acidobacteriota bacterium]
MSETIQPVAFWNNFIRALEAEPQEAVSITGASAIAHCAAGVGLDRGRHRLIVVFCGEREREAAFVQSDLQSAFKSIQVIVVRPSSNAETIEEDRRAGICSFSLGQFAHEEMELILQGGADVEAIKETFRRRNLFQYFFPAPDHLALGLIESGRVRFLPQLIDQLVRTPDLGHPFGPNELMTVKYSFTEMVKELQNLGLVKEGEGGLEITDEGLRARALVRETPREALLNKILNRISANLYLKFLLHPNLKMPR